MRKLALLSTALFGLAFAAPSFAQPSQSGPQPGLPPGAGVGAVNAQPPRATGSVTTTTVGTPAPAPMADSSMAPPAPVYHARRHHRRAARHARHMHAVHHVAPATTDAPAAQ